jgi:signal peptidase I
MDDTITCLAHGNSMYPTINHGDTLIVKKGIDSLDANHIVLYKDDNKKFFVHRIIDFFYCGGIPIIITKGDNCDYDDKPIEIFNIIGVVTEIIKAK